MSKAPNDNAWVANVSTFWLAKIMQKRQSEYRRSRIRKKNVLQLKHVLRTVSLSPVPSLGSDWE
ncbi:MAG: hypothetical protein IJ599_05405 [Alphaproteobacteria bacterium]|nr:hypothetical protein [Alphaproteobacteria bacterium]